MTVKKTEATEEAPKAEEAETPEVKAEATEKPETLTQEKINQLIGEARVKAREDALAEVEATNAAAAKKAREDALLENEQFKELAEQRSAEVTELTTRVTTLSGERDDAKADLERANQALKTYLDDLEKDLAVTDAVKELLEGKSVVDRLEWLTKHRASLKKEDAPKKREGIAPSPEARKKTAAKSEEEIAKKVIKPRSYM